MFAYRAYITSLLLVLTFVLGCSQEDDKASDDQQEKTVKKDPTPTSQDPENNGFEVKLSDSELASEDDLFSSSQFNEFSGLYSPTQTNAAPFFVILGGNFSCKKDGYRGGNTPYRMKMFQYFEEYLKAFVQKNKVAPKFILSCYGKARQVSYVLSSDPDNIIQSSEDALKQVILKETPKNQKIIIVGHSYGGWLAMQLATALIYQRQIIGLFTIDPISATECNILEFVGCTRAPQDLPEDMRRKLGSSISNWKNFYQTETNLLHSSVIPEADTNMLLDGQHFSVAGDPLVWKGVFDLASAQLFPKS